jgi:thiamine kinase-like enzyme
MNEKSSAAAEDPALENLQACLPSHLRGPATIISRSAVGLSGAGVYRVEAAGQTFMLKITGEVEPLAAFRRKLHVQQIAGDAGLAPRIVHADEARRAIVSAFVVDRSLPAFFGDPRTREAALGQLGRTLRRVHELPLSFADHRKDPRDVLASVLSGLAPTGAMPAFVSEAVRRMLTDEPPSGERPVVLSHNDVNPTNLIYDGESILLLDWDTAGPNEPFYDLAAISVFFRMDEATCRKLLEAHDGAPVAQLPLRFTYCRRLVALLCGVMFLNLARQRGVVAAPEEETLDSTLSLVDIYQRLRSGSFSVATPEGQRAFGLTLVKTSLGF